MTKESSSANLLEKLAQEFLAGKKRGENPTIEVYCQKYPALADEIRDLFRTLELLEEFNSDPESDSRSEPLSHGISISGYRLISEIGRGGMGIVYEAEQESLGRHVALKVLPGHLTGQKSAQQRFQREARAAAKMHHTNIVPVFEVGRDGPNTFYAMQLIQGQGLDMVISDLIQMRAGSKDDAKGIVGAQSEHKDNLISSSAIDHRTDLSIIAKTLAKGQFEAQALNPPSPGMHGPTDEATSNAVGTKQTEAANSSFKHQVLLPGKAELSTAESQHRRYWRSVARVGLQVAEALVYAHARGIVHRDIKPSNLILDGAGVVWVTDFGLAKIEDDGMTQTGDILGTLRYMPPEQFKSETDHRSDVYSLGITLYELLVLQPAFQSSDRLKLMEQISNSNPPKPRSIDSRIPRDLETIVLKAIEKEPRSRYASAHDLAEDLRRFIDDEPIRARRTPLVERAVRWSRRNRELATALTVASLITIGLLWGWLSTVSSSLKETKRLAEDARRFAAEALLSKADRAFEERRYQRSAVLATASLDIAPLPGGLAKLQSARANMPVSLAWTSPSLHDITAVEISPDGRFLAAASLLEDVIWLWDLATLRDARQLKGHAGTILSLSFGPRGTYLLSGSKDQTVRLWDVRTGDEVWRRDIHSAASAVAISPDGGTAAAGGVFQGVVWVWQCATGKQIHRFQHNTTEVRALAYSPKGALLASGYRDGTIQVWDLSDEKHRGFPGESPVNSLAFITSGRLASGGDDGVVRVRNVETASTVQEFRGHQEAVKSLAISPTRGELATGSSDGSIRFWDLRSGEEREPERINVPGHVSSVAYNPDGSQLIVSSQNDRATGIGDRPIQFIDRQTGKATAWTAGHTNYVNTVVFDRTGKQLITAGHDATIRMWDVQSGKLLRRLVGHTNRITCIDIQRNGSLAASSSWDKTVRVWNSETGEQVTKLDLPSGAESVAFHPQGHVLVTGTSKVQFWTTAGWEPFASINVKNSVMSLSISPDGNLVACGLYNGDILIFEFATQRQVARLIGHTNKTESIEFSSDGKRLASASGDNTARLWDIESQREIIRMEHPLAVHSVAFAPVGNLLATASFDRMVRFWSAESGVQLGEIEGHRRLVASLAFSRDGRFLGTGSHDQVRLWRLNDVHSRSQLSGHLSGKPIDWIEFSPDGSLLAMHGDHRDKRLRLWNMHTHSIEYDYLTDQGFIRATFDSRGRWLAVSSAEAEWASSTEGDCHLELIDLHSFHRFPMESVPPYVIDTLAFNSLGTRLATGSRAGEISIWNPDDRNLNRSFSANTEPVSCLIFSPTDDDLLASASWDGMIYLWDLSSSNRPIGKLDGHKDKVYSLAFSSNGKQLASSSPGDSSVILLWDVESGQILQRFRGHRLGINSVAISQDGRWVASGAQDGTVRLWDADSGNELVRFAEHAEAVNRVVFTADGKHLFSTSSDGTIRSRDLRTAADLQSPTRQHVEAETGLFLDGNTIGPIPKRVQWWVQPDYRKP